MSDQEPIALTLAVNNIAELQDRQATYSNQISIPLTAKNKIILGNAELVGSVSKKPYQFNHTTYIENGIIILPAGISQIFEYSDNKIQIVLYSGILDFFSIIKEKKLSDLNLSEFDHVWNAETAAFLNSNGGSENACIYPIIQTGAISKIENKFEIQYQVPSIYFKVLVDKIFSEAGYSKSGLIFTDSLYNKMIVSCNGELTLTQKFIDARSCIVGTTQVLYKSISGFAENGNWGPFVFPFNNENDETFYNNRLITGVVKTGYKDGELNCFNNLQYKYVAAGSYTISIDVAIPILINMRTGRSEIKIILYKNGVEIANKPINTGLVFGNEFQTIKIDGYKDVCSLGDEYWVTFEVNDLFTGLATYDLTVPHFTNGNLTAENCYFKVTVLSEININMKLPVSQILPDMTQSDFIKAWAQMFGIVFQADGLTNTMQCVQFKEIPRSLPIDWSKKLDLNQPIAIEYRFDGYGQVNNLKYKEGEETEKEGLGDSFFKIDDSTLEKSKDAFTLPFQASDSTTVMGDVLSAAIPMYQVKTGIPISYEKEDIGPRIFAVKTIDKEIIYKDNVNPEEINLGITRHPVAYFNELSQDRNLTFKSDLQPNNYTELIQALDRCKIVRAYFYLKAADIQNLDFFRQIYVEYFNCMFYVNVVEQYIEGRSTLVELVRL